MKRALIAFLLVVFSASFAPGARARTWYVKADRTGDVPTIQAGIDSAAVGDTVLVAAGTYGWASQGTGTQYGMIYIQRGQNGFVLRSEAGPHATVLDGEYQGRVFFIAGWNYITVEGFTIRRGMAPSFGDWTGGGVATHLSHDLYRNCIFRDNIANSGGALWCGGVSSPTLEDCEFFNNQAINGGAVLLVNSSQTPTFRNCSFTRNRASGGGGAIYAVHNGFNLENCVIALNSAETTGGAIYARDVWPSSIVSCTIAENSAADGTAIHLNACPSVQLERSIVAFGAGGTTFTSSNGSVLSVSCSDVFGNTTDVLPSGVVDGGGTFSADPLFCGPRGSLVYTVSGTSPCAPGLHPDGNACSLIGAKAPACGSVTIEPVTWGQLKALYRSR
ncbi:MAG TPA: right-handed parallel beta-helix repeat-containing protein [Candidatus Krumholzibacteria bacterium]|nr:right-handed parallel beta-helix repeat-containing protein [Candidatus Krumholzibacteria bacterium]